MPTGNVAAGQASRHVFEIIGAIFIMLGALLFVVILLSTVYFLDK